MTAQQLPAEDAGWEDIRARYEAGVEPLTVIAEAASLSPLQLSLKAKALGWLLRTRMKRRARAESTSATLKRLKELLHKRISALEQEINAIGEDVNALSGERGIRSVNTLVRTLEKVLELERKNRTRKARLAKDFKQLDDAERAALADKLESLGKDWAGDAYVAALAAAGSERSGPDVDLLGTGKPAAAAGSDAVSQLADPGGQGRGQDAGRR